VAAAALIPEGFEVPPRALAAGVPATIKKTDVPGDWVEGAVKTYIASARRYRAGLRCLSPQSPSPQSPSAQSPSAQSPSAQSLSPHNP
jgi:hypothetical protein